MKIIVFDLDGTLLDTLADIAAACNEILTKHHFPVHPIPAYRYMVGNGFTTLIERALPADARVLPDRLDIMVQEAREHYALHMMAHTRPYAGICESLAALAASGLILGVLSNKPDALSKELIYHYFPAGLFRFVQGALPDVPLKPNPEALLAWIKALDADKRACCYVGDSNVDMQTAANAKISGIGAAWGFRGADELKEHGADKVLSCPAELPILAQL